MTAEGADPGSPAAGGEAGFSLVEVMITLVMAAMLAIAVGGLISFAVTLRDRSERSEKTISAILEVEALRNAALEAAGPAKGITIGSPETTGYVLVAPDSRRHLPMRIAIEREAAGTPLTIGLSFADAAEDATTSVDLALFDDAFIDYLTGTGDDLAWRPADSVSGEPIAARLSVIQGKRRWTIPLWVVPRGTAD
ncbi:MAG: type II secretion system protein [Devosia sp.]